MQRFGQLTQVNAAATVLAEINGDVDRTIHGVDSGVLFYQLPNKMKQPLILFTVKDVLKV